MDVTSRIPSVSHRCPGVHTRCGLQRYKSTGCCFSYSSVCNSPTSFRFPSQFFRPGAYSPLSTLFSFSPCASPSSSLLPSPLPPSATRNLSQWLAVMVRFWCLTPPNFRTPVADVLPCLLRSDLLHPRHWILRLLQHRSRLCRRRRCPNHPELPWRRGEPELVSSLSTSPRSRRSSRTIGHICSTATRY